MFRLMIRGGQTLAHAVSMAWQVLRLSLMVGLVSGGMIFAGFLGIGLAKNPTLKPWVLTWMKARLVYTVSPTFTSALMLHGKVVRLPSALILTHPLVEKTERLFQSAAAWSLHGAFFTLWVFLAGLLWRGYRLRKDKLLSGRYLTHKNVLQRELAQRGPLGLYRLAGVHLPLPAWHQHVFIHGTTGTGKSRVLRQLCEDIRKRGDKAIVYDNHQGFLPYYYHDGVDVLLNPLDKRCAHWDLWEECQTVAELEGVAEALLPKPTGNQEPFWVQSAHTVFVAMAERLRNETPETRLAQLVKLLQTASLKTLSTLLKDTPAQALLSPESEKTALSIQSVVSNMVRLFLLLLHEKKESSTRDETPPFSIRTWLNREDSAWLWLGGQAKEAELLRPLLSMWCDVVGRQLLSLPVTASPRRIWIILDELASLQRLPSLLSLLAESRKFGGALVLSTQNIAQVKALYGQDNAKAIVDLCNTRLFFRSPAHDTARWVSDELGQGEWLRVEEGISYGASRIRDGVSLQRQRVIRPAVTPERVQGLADGEAILHVPPLGKKGKKVPKRWPLAKVTVPSHTPIIIAEGVQANAIMISHSNANVNANEVRREKEKDDIEIFDNKECLTTVSQKPRGRPRKKGKTVREPAS